MDLRSFLQLGNARFKYVVLPLLSFHPLTSIQTTQPAKPEQLNLPFPSFSHKASPKPTAPSSPPNPTPPSQEHFQTGVTDQHSPSTPHHPPPPQISPTSITTIRTKHCISKAGTSTAPRTTQFNPPAQKPSSTSSTPTQPVPKQASSLSASIQETRNLHFSPRSYLRILLSRASILRTRFRCR